MENPQFYKYNMGKREILTNKFMSFIYSFILKNNIFGWLGHVISPASEIHYWLSVWIYDYVWAAQGKPFLSRGSVSHSIFFSNIDWYLDFSSF